MSDDEYMSLCWHQFHDWQNCGKLESCEWCSGNCSCRSELLSVAEEMTEGDRSMVQLAKTLLWVFLFLLWCFNDFWANTWERYDAMPSGFFAISACTGWVDRKTTFPSTERSWFCWLPACDVCVSKWKSFFGGSNCCLDERGDITLTIIHYALVTHINLICAGGLSRRRVVKVSF